MGHANLMNPNKDADLYVNKEKFKKEQEEARKHEEKRKQKIKPIHRKMAKFFVENKDLFYKENNIDRHSINPKITVEDVKEFYNKHH